MIDIDNQYYHYCGGNGTCLASIFSQADPLSKFRLQLKKHRIFTFKNFEMKCLFWLLKASNAEQIVFDNVLIPR